MNFQSAYAFVFFQNTRLLLAAALRLVIIRLGPDFLSKSAFMARRRQWEQWPQRPEDLRNWKTECVALAQGLTSTRRDMVDPAEHSLLSRIEDTARYVASMVISNTAFRAGGTAPYSNEEWRRRTHEFTMPQTMDRLQLSPVAIRTQRRGPWLHAKLSPTRRPNCDRRYGPARLKARPRR